MILLAIIFIVFVVLVVIAYSIYNYYKKPDILVQEKKSDKENKESETKDTSSLGQDLPSVTQVAQPDFWGSKGRPQAVLEELRELKEETEKQQIAPVKKDIFLIITRDVSIFDSFLPAGGLVAEISSIVSELHIVFIGKKQNLPNRKENTFLYFAWDIPFLNFFTVYQVILSQLVWKGSFRPTLVVSIGDEVEIAKKISKKYNRPLYVFYSYMKALGNGKISMNALIKASPQKIIIPNEYIEQAIKNHHGYKSEETELKIIPEYIDIPELEHIFDGDNAEKEADSRNNIFSMILFPHHANLACFLIVKKITKEISTSIRKFQFYMVVKPHQFLQAKILRSLFKLPIIISRERKDSIDLFHTSRVMLYFDRPKGSYEPIFYSFISGCPVLSSGDEYSKIVLFNSDLEEFGRLERNGKTFGTAIKRLINDPYLYSKYKINCSEFSKTAFTHDHDAYMVELKNVLNIAQKES